jgi:hypothetical protein
LVPACPCPLARIGLAVLPPGMVARLEGMEPEQAAAELERLAGVLTTR